jgi:hypothetical protein
MGEVRVERFMEKRRYHPARAIVRADLPSREQQLQRHREIHGSVSLIVVSMCHDNHHNRMDCLTTSFRHEVGGILVILPDPKSVFMPKPVLDKAQVHDHCRMEG